MPVMEDAPIGAVATALSRRQIMDVTARCLREEGYDATTIRRIAAILDCAVGSIYRYFHDKRDLLDAVSQAALAPAADAAEAGAAMAETARLYHRLADRDPAMYRLMFWLTTVRNGWGESASQSHEPPPPPAPPLPKVIERIIAAWADQLGDLPRARRCWVTLHGGIMLGMGAGEVMDMLVGMAEPAALGSSEMDPQRHDVASMRRGMARRGDAARRLFSQVLPVVVEAGASPSSEAAVRREDQERRDAAEAAEAAAEEVVLL